MILFKEVRVGGATQSPFSPQGIFYIPLLTLGYLFTSPFSPQGIFYIPLLIPGNLLHSPSHPRVSFTFPFSHQGIFYIPLLTPGYLLPPLVPRCHLHPPSHPSTSLTSLSSSIKTHTNRHISRRLSTDSGLVCIFITDNKDKYLGNS